VSQAAPVAARRRFLNWFLGTSVGAMCASILYPLARYMIPPDVPEAQTSRVVAGHEGDLKPNEGKIGSSPKSDQGSGRFPYACQLAVM